MLGCHIHPVCKSKDKPKGTKTMKLRSIELIDCLAGSSAIDAIAYLASHEQLNIMMTVQLMIMITKMILRS
ncbi:hypothetical protein Hanom_Chr10g00907701 [Helianthus anomalus]